MAKAMAKAETKPGGTVVPLFGGPEEDEAEIAVGMPHSGGPVAGQVATRAPALAGVPVWYLIGANYSGKTTFARWMCGRMLEAGRSAVMAAADPANRTLADFFEAVAQPPSNDAGQTAGWLQALTDHVITHRLAGVVDMGGGDTALGKVVDLVPTLAPTMEEAGVSPVAAYFLGPRVDDLGTLAGFEAKGFQPRATVLVLNHGRVPAEMDGAGAFAAVRRHSVFRSAVDRGAVVVEMPRLDPAALALEIERRRLHFAAVRDGQTPIGGLRRAGVSAWMTRMEAAFGPVVDWLT